jgi:hypothetical protein
MEAFPAADEEQFQFIKTVILQCDYYVLIIAGRYGSVDEQGVSYTEKEFDYAVSQEIPVLAFLHENIGQLPSEKVDTEKKSVTRLQSFIKKVSQNRLRKSWTTEEGLQLAVREALDHAFRTKPRPGWIRGDTAATSDVLQELARTRRENTRLQDYLSETKSEISMPKLPKLEDETIIRLIPIKELMGYGSFVNIKATWVSIFSVFYTNYKETSHMMNNGDEVFFSNPSQTCRDVADAIQEIFTGARTSQFELSMQSYLQLRAFYIESGLMREGDDGPSFTELGRRLARRHLVIHAQGNPKFSLIEGSFHIEDEIPF